MARRIRILVAGIAMLGLVAGAATPAFAVETNELDRPPLMVDVLLIRPASLVTTLASIMLFVPAAAITGITRPQNIGAPYRVLVAQPLAFTFMRPLGEW